MSIPRTTIVGAGLAGLVLARVLHVRGIDAVVLEGDADRSERTQGGMLDIHDDGGQLALRSAGLHDAFLDLVFPGGDAYRLVEADGRLLREEAGSRRDESDSSRGVRPEVERGALRDLLLDSLPVGTVRWGLGWPRPVRSATVGTRSS